MRLKGGGRGCACEGAHLRCVMGKAHSRDYVLLRRRSRTHKHPQQDIYGYSHRSRYAVYVPYPPHVSPHALCHYVSGLLAPCCQSTPRGFPPRPRCSALTSTKAGTVCQLDAPRRPIAPEVRNKDDAAAPAASENKGEREQQGRLISGLSHRILNLRWDSLLIFFSNFCSHPLNTQVRRDCSHEQLLLNHRLARWSLLSR